jgi:hypothetical protein
LVKKHHAKPGGKNFQQTLEENNIKMKDVYNGTPFLNRAVVTGKD